MTGEERRTQILQMLKDQTSPLSGTALADAFHVSRQVIVQDIALMRAENHRILSTNRGYLYHRTDSAGLLPKRVVSVRHTTEPQQDAQEFYEKLMQSKDEPLKILTGDCHYHTIAAPSEKLLDLIEQALQKDGFLR